MSQDKKIPNNPLAFSVFIPEHSAGEKHPPVPARLEQGMTLRDYFAARTIPLLSYTPGHEQELAEKAYKIADAMLVEREKSIRY